MKSYSSKIFLIYSGTWSIVNFGWFVSNFVFLSNSLEQHKVFAIMGVLSWLVCYIIAIPFVLLWASPVSKCIQSLKEGRHVPDDELHAAVKRNQRLPIYCAIIYDVLVCVFDIIVFTGYRAYGIGPIASAGIWTTNIAAITSLPVIVIGGLNLIANPVHGYLNEELERRGLSYAGAKSKIRNKLFIAFVVIAIAVPAWLGGLGFYAAGIDQIKYEAQSTISAYQQMAIANMKVKGGDNPGLDTLKTLVYDLRNEEIGFSFLADKNGQIIYNPSNKNILVDKWVDINDRLTKALASGEKGSLYENVNENVICFAPITGDYRLGTVSRMQDRLPRFAYFFVWLTTFFFVCVFISICAGYTLFTDISNSVVSTATALKDLSEGDGDLTARFRVMAEDETGDLARYFNSLMEKLNSTIGLSQKAARLVEEGAMQQASAVEETSASMKEFADNATLNLQNVEKMDKVIEVVAKDMINANESMYNLMKEMEQLKIASDKTGKIIKTIDEISFQTNLLALNAAVEAARAGEAGAGFAVVADEVRNLAMRATDSAKNTDSLIAETVKRINNGSEMVLKAGQDFAMLSKRSQESRQLVADITKSIKEQDLSIQQVNDALNEVDQMTQQNAIQADSLMANLAMFKTSEEEKEPEDS